MGFKSGFVAWHYTMKTITRLDLVFNFLSIHIYDFGNKIEICFGQVFGIQLMFFYFEVDSLNFPLHLQTHGLAEYIAQVRNISNYFLFIFHICIKLDVLCFANSFPFHLSKESCLLKEALGRI